MDIVLPSEVVYFLNLIGIPFPDVNADDVRALGKYILDFAISVQHSHEAATGVITDIGAVYSGESYDALVAAWARMSATHMTELDDACRVVATALDIAAEVIVAVKVAVLGELAALAASYVVVLATPGAFAFSTAIREVTRRLCNGMEEMLVSYIAAEVIGKAIQPLEDTINSLIKETVREAVGLPNGFGAQAPPSTAGAHALIIEPQEVNRYADILDRHAEDILQHARRFADNVAELTFTTSNSWDNIENPTFSAEWDSLASAPRSLHASSGASADKQWIPVDSELPLLTARPGLINGTEFDVNSGHSLSANTDEKLSANTDGNHSLSNGRPSPQATAAERDGGDRSAMTERDAAPGAPNPWPERDNQSPRWTDANNLPPEYPNGRITGMGQTSDDYIGAHSSVADAQQRVASSAEIVASNGEAHAGFPKQADIQEGQLLPGQPQAAPQIPSHNSPWGRSAYPPTPRADASQSVGRQLSATAASPAARKPKKTPWSKTRRKAPNDKPAVAKDGIVAPPLKPSISAPANERSSRDRNKDIDSITAESGEPYTVSGSIEPVRKHIVIPPTRS
ncbi:WXG100-like domain-containing protein [Nocardia sp. NPDC004750]